MKYFRGLALLMSAVMAMSLFPTGVLAAEESEEGDWITAEEKMEEALLLENTADDLESSISGQCGESLVWEIDNKGTLTISGNGEMYDYDIYHYEDQKESPWSGQSSIISVVVEEGVVNIGACAFEGCEGISTVVLPNSLKSIGSCSFSDCKNLKSITIPDGVISINREAFWGCEKLTDIIIPDSVSYFGEHAFYDTPWFESLEGLAIINNYLFKYTGEETEIIIPEGVEVIWENAFQDCLSLEKVTFPESLTTMMGDAFQGCKKLKAISFPGNMTEITDGSFYGCESLTSVIIPNNITYIGYSAFSGCTGLTSITIPGSVESVDGSAFKNCKNLTSVTISEGVKYIAGDAFIDCDSLMSVTIPSSVSEIDFQAFGWRTIEEGSQYQKIDGFVISGYTNSAAETYANENGFAFISIGEVSPEDPFIISGTLYEGENEVSVGEGETVYYSFIPEADESYRIYSVGDNDTIGYLYDANYEELVEDDDGGENNNFNLEYSLKEGQEYYVGVKYFDSESSGTVSIIIEAGEEPSDPFDVSEVLFEGENEIEIAEGETVYCSFFAEEDGDYFIYSTGENDTYGVLYDENYEELATDDNTGDNNNFKMKYTLIAGNFYYVGIKYNDSNCSGPVSILLHTIPRIRGTLFEGENEISTVEAEMVYYSYIPQKDGYHTFYSIGEEDTYGCLYDENYVELVSNDDNGNNKSFKISYLLVAGQEYYIGIMNFDANLNETCIVVEAPFDSGGFLNEGENVISLGEGETLYYSFIPEDNENYIIYSIGEYDTYGSLYSNNYRELASNNDAGTDKNFRILYSLTSGQRYYIGIKPYSSGGYGTVSIMIEKHEVSCSGECGADGDSLFWDLDNEGTLTISGEGELANYWLEDTEEGVAPWYSNRDSIIDVVIDDGVQNIGVFAFHECNNLASIMIPDGIASIGDGAFYSCDSLENITIPDSVTSIGDRAFSNCSNLTSINLPSGLTKISNGLFEECENLETVRIPESVTSIGERAFYGCYSLSDVNIPKKANSILRYAFSRCDNLHEIIIPDGVEEIYSHTFSFSGLFTVELQGATEIGECAFEGCFFLSEVRINDGLEWIGPKAFEGCSRLRRINIPGTVKRIGANAFYDCINAILFIPDTVESIEENALDYHWAFTNASVKKEGWEDEPHYYNIQKNEWEYWSTLDRTQESIILPNYITLVPDGAFYADNFVSITISESVTSIEDYAFAECRRLTNIRIPNTVSSIGTHVFSGCISLANVTLPEGITGIGEHTFKNCSSLIDISIPKKVTSINNYAFQGCTQLANIMIPEGVTTIGNNTFEECNSLTSIMIPESVTSIGQSAFYGCRSLASITIPEKVTCIPDYIFKNCSSLTNVIISQSVTNIGNYAFEYCNSLADVYYAGSEENWTKISIGSGNYKLAYVTIHYNSYGTTLEEGAFRFYQQNDIFYTENTKQYANVTTVDRESVIYGFFDGQTRDDEFSQINWTVSDPSILAIVDVVDIPLMTLTDDVTSISLDWEMTVKGLRPGTVTIQGETIDGRMASREFTVEPSLQISGPSSINKISEFSCSIEIPADNAEYLNSFINGIKVEGYSSVSVKENTIEREVTDARHAVLRFKVEPLIQTSSPSSDVVVDTPDDDRSPGLIFTTPGGLQTTFNITSTLKHLTEFSFVSAVADVNGALGVTWDPDLLTRGYEPDAIQAKLTITYMPINASNAKAHVDEIEFALSDELPMFKFEGGNSALTVKVDKDLKDGESYSCDIKLVKKGIIWQSPGLFSGKLEGRIFSEIKGTFPDVTGNLKPELTISITEKPKSTDPDDPKEDNSELYKDAEDAINAYNLQGTLALDPNLKRHLGNNDQAERLVESIEYIIYTQIALANLPKEAYGDSITEEIINQIKEKYWKFVKTNTGIDVPAILALFEDYTVTLEPMELPLSLKVQTEAYGWVQLDFNCQASYYQMEGENFGIMVAIPGTLTYLDADKAPREAPIVLDSGIMAQSDVTAFTQAAWKVASAEIKANYNTILGNDLNKFLQQQPYKGINAISSMVAKYGIERPTKAMLTTLYEKKFKSKIDTFEFLSYPSKLVVARCPVDLYVYDTNDDLLAYTDGENVTVNSPDVDMWTAGDEKYARLYDASFRIEYISRDTGTMDLDIYQMGFGNDVMNVTRFYDVPLEVGINYENVISAQEISTQDDYTLTSSEDNSVQADEFIELEEGSSWIDEIVRDNPEEVPVNSITLDHASAEMKTKSTLQLAANIEPENASYNGVVWESSNPSVTTVDENGLVTALTYGKATITATTQDGSKSALCEIQTRYHDVAGSPNKGDEDYQYFFTPVYWAADNNITKGYGNVYFGPDENCTREQMITFLYRTAGSPAVSGNVSFSDVKKGSYYYNAVLWAAQKGITKGYSSGPNKGKFGVGLPVTREDTVTFIYRMAGKPKYSTTKSFKDVAKGKYYYDPVRWAAQNKITNGYSDGTFGVGKDVLRKDIVTFLYRYANLK